MSSRKILIASDHAGFPLKTYLKDNLKFLGEADIEWIDLGTNDEKSVDYPDFAQKLSNEILAHKAEFGILACGSGQGQCMKANRNKGIRAALCWDEVSARLSREHNNANVLCMGARLIPFGLAVDIARVWLSTKFLGGRHERRVEKLDL